MKILTYIILLIIGILIIYFHFFKKSPDESKGIEPNFEALDDDDFLFDDWADSMGSGYIEDDCDDDDFDNMDKSKFIRTLALIGIFLDSNDKLYIDDNIHITKEIVNSYNQHIKYNIFYKNDYIGEATNRGIILQPLIEYVDDGSNTFPMQTKDSQFDYKTIENKLTILIISKHDELKEQHAIQHNLLNAAQKEIYNELLNKLP